MRKDEPLSVLTLFERVFVRANLTCDETVEIPYYSSEKFVNICSNCACSEVSEVQGQYPLCQYKII